MKLLHFTDTHIKGIAPSGRIDDYTQSLYNKFCEVYEIAKKSKVEAILFSGDLFDSNIISLSVAKKFIDLIESKKIPFYVIFGNHDKRDNNREGTLLDYTASYTTYLKVLDELTLSNGTYIKGYEYEFGIEESIRRNGLKCPNKKDTNFSIALLHANLVPSKVHEAISHVIYKDVKTDYDIVLIGHYHPYAEPVTIGKTTFYNVGALSRNARKKSDIERIPSVLIIDTDNKKIDKIELTKYVPAEQAFDLKEIEELHDKENKISKVIAELGNIEFKSLDIKDRILEVCKTQVVEDTVKEDLLRRVGHE